MTKYRLWWAIARVVLLPLVLLYALVWAQHNQHIDTITYPPLQSSPEALMVECNTPVEGVLPTGVVIIPEGKATVRLSHNTRLIGEALDQTLAKGPTHHTVFGFCA